MSVYRWQDYPLGNGTGHRWATCPGTPRLKGHPRLYQDVARTSLMTLINSYSYGPPGPLCRLRPWPQQTAKNKKKSLCRAMYVYSAQGPPTALIRPCPLSLVHICVVALRINYFSSSMSCVMAMPRTRSDSFYTFCAKVF